MQQMFNQFYQQFGVRRPQNLFSPKIFIMTDIPYDSVLHLLDDDNNFDVDVSKLYFKLPKFIYVENKAKIDKFPTSIAPRYIPTNVNNLARAFFLKNRKFHVMTDLYKGNIDKKIPLVVNYNYLQQVYKFNSSALQAYFEYKSFHKAMWDNIAASVTKTARNHFVFIDLPKELPSYSLLNNAAVKIGTGTLKIFDSWNKLAILELWKWLDPKQKNESLISVIPDDYLGRIDIVFNLPDGRSSIINLGYLYSWIKGHKNITDFTSSQFEPLTMQKLFLKFLITLDSFAHDDEETTNEPEMNLISDLSKDTKSEKKLDEDSELANFMDLDKQLEDIDADIQNLENFNSRKLKDKGLRVDNSGEVLQSEQVTKDLSEMEVEDLVFKPKNNHDALQEHLDEYADYGILSASEFKKLAKEADGYNNLRNPYNPKQLFKDSITVTQDDISLDTDKNAIVASENVIDKTMLESSLISFDEDYIDKVMKKDILGIVSDVQQAGIIIKSHEVEDDISALGGYENHTLELRPIDGAPSTIRFRIPKIDADGSFVSNSNKYRMRKQRVDIPIRKIDANTVALTTYYGKNFVSRGRKKANNAGEWIINQVTKAGMSDHPYITKVYPGKVFNHNFVAPYIYNALATAFKGIKAGKYNLYFSFKDRLTLIDDGLRQQLEVNGRVLVGLTDKKSPILVDMDNEFFVYDPPKDPNVKQMSLWPIGNIYDVLQLPEESAPVDFTEVRIFSKTIPVAIALSYFIGFKNLLTLIKAKYRIVEGRKQKSLAKHEYSIGFKDVSYIFSRKDVLTGLIVGGFLDFEKLIKKYDVADFNNKDVYLNLLASKGMSSLYIRELELTDQMFVDSISKSILESMNEPTTFRGLLVRATEMLVNYHHKAPQDMSEMRIRGYERISGFIYKELVTSIRSFKNRNISGKSKIEMSPYQVYNAIIKDPTIKIPEDVNPIQNLKESEVVTYVGEGGRSKDSMMNKETRVYNQSDVGVISEATVDSSDVGINAYMSANPNFKNLRGITAPPESQNSAKLLSTSACLAPGVDGDDMKRVNFIQIQQSHTIATDGYHQPVIRTGYESVIASRTSSMFAFNARKDGKVISKNKHGITIEYSDGERKGVALGRIYGRAEGSIYPHDILTTLNTGDSFKKGDNIAYNSGFFEQDFLDPKNVIYKGSMLVKTVLWESNQTFEDSSSISSDLSQRMSAKTTKLKSVTVDFSQNILNAVSPGQKIHPKDVYMVIEDQITSNTTYFDEDSLSVLRKLSKQAPTSKYEGVVDRIEVFYHGDKEDMSPSLRALADASDKLMSDIAKASSSPVITGKVNSDYRVSGTPLSLDKAEIKIYVTISTPAGVGD